MELLKGALKKSTKDLGLGDLFRTGSLPDEWAEIVGKKLAEKTSPVSIREKTLLIRTANPSWSHHLSSVKPQIIGKLNLAGYEIKDLRFKAGLIGDENNKQAQKNKT